jgi:hypothetical protein
MSSVIAAPELIAAAATDLRNIGSTLGSSQRRNGRRHLVLGRVQHPRRPGGRGCVTESTWWSASTAR